MKASSFELRFHVPIVVLIYLLGFYAPWERFTGNGHVEPAWLWSASLLTRLGVNLGSAVLSITLAGLLFAAIGTGLRLLSSTAAILSYRSYGLYLGSWLFHFSLAILMPPTGALFALTAHGLLTWRLIASKEGSSTLSAKKPAWRQAILSESYFLGYFFCFASLAWRYDAFLLARCAILSFGGWLVLKAISYPK